MNVTSHHVARLAGVSQPTVSRALRGDSRVAPGTRQRVLEAAAALGYVPSQVGRSLSTSATHQVAMVADLENPLYPRLVGPLHDALRDLGYSMVVLAERGEGERTPERLLDRSVDGAILTTSLLRSPMPYQLVEKGVPLVQLNRTSDLVDADSIVADNYGGGMLIADLLLKLGHTRVGAILGPQQTSTSRDRERGLRDGLAKQNVPLPSAWTARSNFSYQDGFDGFCRIAAGKDTPTAVACINDVVAVGALNAATSLGLRVPEDITVVGFDDLELAAWPCFQITTVRVDLSAMATRAAHLLVQRLRQQSTVPPVHEHFPVILVTRRTHSAPP